MGELRLVARFGQKCRENFKNEEGKMKKDYLKRVKIGKKHSKIKEYLQLKMLKFYI